MNSNSPVISAPTGDDYPDYDVVVHSTVCLGRNLSSFRFPWRSSPEETAAALSALTSAASAIGLEIFVSGQLSPADRMLLAERELISRAFLIDEASGFAFDPSRPVWVVFNEADHCSLRARLPGLDLDRAWSYVSETDDKMGSLAGWAFDPDAGYLTTEAIRCGSGLSATVLLHLPALIMAGLAETAFKRAMEAGFVVGGAFAARGSSAGNLFGLSLPPSSGELERDALGRLSRAAKALADYERRARNDILGQSPGDILDIAGRAAGAAAYARLVGRDEAADIVSGLRFGLCTGVLEGQSVAGLTELWITSRMARSGTDGDEPDTAVRARVLRKATSAIRIARGYIDV